MLSLSHNDMLLIHYTMSDDYISEDWAAEETHGV